MKNKIYIASAIILNPHKDLLVVRKYKSTYHMLPGGKIEAGEEPIQTLVRELNEELSLQFAPEDFNFLGAHETAAANEADTIVVGNIFLLQEPLNFLVEASAEIEEVKWISKTNYSDFKLAHLLEEFALPKWLSDFQ